MAFTIEKDEILRFIFQVVCNILSLVGSIIVFIYFLRKQKKAKQENKPISIVHQTMLHLVICSGLLAVMNLSYHIWRVIILPWAVSGYKPGEGLPLKEWMSRILFLIRITTQYFVISCCCWTVCIAVSLMYALSDRKQSRPISPWKIQLAFVIFSYIFPLIDAMLWGLFFQLCISPDGNFYGGLPEDVEDVLSSIYYFSHAAFLLIGFFANSLLLMIIWLRIRKAFYKIESMKLSSIVPHTAKIWRRHEISIALNLSFYIIPFLICASWQVIGYILLGINSETADNIFYAITYPYSFFFPLQGLLNCIVYSLNKRWAKQMVYNICCFICIYQEKRRQKAVDESMTDSLLTSGFPVNRLQPEEPTIQPDKP